MQTSYGSITEYIREKRWKLYAKFYMIFWVKDEFLVKISNSDPGYLLPLKPYTCQYCQEAFHRWDQKKRHEQNHEAQVRVFPSYIHVVSRSSSLVFILILSVPNFNPEFRKVTRIIKCNISKFLVSFHNVTACWLIHLRLHTFWPRQGSCNPSYSFLPLSSNS